MSYKLSTTALITLLSLHEAGCVITTASPPGTPPEVPVKPSPVSQVAEEEISGPTSIAARHILISYRGAMRAAAYIDRSKDEARAVAERIRQEAIDGADFAELARSNSDDRGSAATGGQLGTFGRGQMVPEFSAVAFKLEIDELSEVTESPFGFHIIQRLE
ncbi:MAG: peptidyl-prolyl cis-trans isomerase [Polyangiaceae bacterium]|nr:peptidyl-prolyl cis-trans isomerase [Polyangiaceae bacterium]